MKVLLRADWSNKSYIYIYLIWWQRYQYISFFYFYILDIASWYLYIEMILCKWSPRDFCENPILNHQFLVILPRESNFISFSPTTPKSTTNSFNLCEKTSVIILLYCPPLGVIAMPFSSFFDPHATSKC